MNNIPELTQIKKVMIANMLISQGIQQSEAWEMIDLLENDLQIMDEFSVNFYKKILYNIYNNDSLEGEEGELINLLIKLEKSKEIIENKKAENKKIQEVIDILGTPVKNELSARILIRKISPLFK